MTEVKYRFTVKGILPDGTKPTLSGWVMGPDGFPPSVFDSAVAICTHQTEGLVVDRAAPGNVTLTGKRPVKPFDYRPGYIEKVGV